MSLNISLTVTGFVPKCLIPQVLVCKCITCCSNYMPTTVHCAWCVLWYVGFNFIVKCSCHCYHNVQCKYGTELVTDKTIYWVSQFKEIGGTLKIKITMMFTHFRGKVSNTPSNYMYVAHIICGHWISNQYITMCEVTWWHGVWTQAGHKRRMPSASHRCCKTLLTLQFFYSYTFSSQTS